ncbi:hypothetical protein DRN69_00600 [Candidatus Pacearchaeota archaeon]|nr:MAG: hypothetical protein DRN69_00600 [Candidatus Pacearchaeota archaeon]
MTKKTSYNQKTQIKGALRRLFSRSPVKNEVLNEAVHPTKKGIRGGKQYICNICKNTFPLKDVQVDHKKPVIKASENINDIDYNTLVDRIFCKKSNLQVICKICHKKKSAKERRKRLKKRKI